MTEEEDRMGETTDGADLWEMVPRLLLQSSYCVLGTADAEGEPRTTPVFFAVRSR